MNCARKYCRNRGVENKFGSCKNCDTHGGGKWFYPMTAQGILHVDAVEADTDPVNPDTMRAEYMREGK